MIKELAHACGFPLCSITRPMINARNRQALLDWIAAGHFADMAWMTETVRLERRLHPGSMLDAVESVIVLGMPYQVSDGLPRSGSPAQGMIAAYAQGDDYHDVMKKKLRAFCRSLQSHADHGTPDQRIYVDTAPVLEHALAEAGGLGWLGKHSLSIDRQYGSWFMLGEVFTTAILPVDSPVSAHCGTCTACINQCPTAAIVAPMTVDARRCISWLTIEFKGFIPEDLRPLMGLHIYGCDDCQSCCPWNDHACIADRYFLETREENILPTLASLLCLDDTGFRQRFKKSPIKRTGREAFVRNVCIAAGNTHDNQLYAPLRLLLTDDSAIVRAHAAWALVRVANHGQQTELLACLQQALALEAQPQVRGELLSAYKYRSFS
ncbi:MAG: tRNA epoxyqueuosine(34) reductase QueG [Mariprofundaceae bacterium]|nr:tRNA epoxyqueuosine(34) reductase QueG [Mariprofundaceae bacterium]